MRTAEALMNGFKLERLAMLMEPEPGIRRRSKAS